MKHLQFLKDLIRARTSAGNDDAFYLCDIEDVKRKYNKWNQLMPRVIPFYAIKSNNHTAVVKCLAEAGAGFDCASREEIKKVLSLGVNPSKIIYSHTAKQISHLKFAAEKNVRKVTFDCEQELLKIKQFHPNAEVVLRIKFDSDTTVIRLGLKFGCDRFLEAPKLIQKCRELNLNLIGVSFHVGSGTEESEVFGKAIEAVKKVFDEAKVQGFELKLVDIGGGFMGYDAEILNNYAEMINTAIEKHFPDPSVAIISEPGRYFVESAFTRVVQIVLKRQTCDGTTHYYVNDGVYMSFLMDLVYKGEYLKHGGFDVIRQEEISSTDVTLQPSVIWGISCSSMDKIMDNLMPELDMSDWLLFKNMGAYTTAVATTFNGFEIDNEDIIVL